MNISKEGVKTNVFLSCKDLTKFYELYHELRLFYLLVTGELKIEICMSKLLVKVKVKDSRNRSGLALSVPGGLGSHIFMTFGT